MVYKFLRILATIACKVYFKKLHITGLDKVPQNGPLLIACNHPNGFAEPILLSCFLPRILHFLVRGDVFNIKPLKPLLIKTNQIPIFRSKDGFSNLRNNNKSFEAVIDHLSKDAAILIFVEGTTQLTKRLRPLQKGMSKLAFMAREEFPDLEINVLPVGVNFTHPKKFRSEAIINVGEAFAISNYEAAYQENPQKAYRQITKDTSDRMSPLVLSINEDALDAYECLAEMTRAKIYQPYYPFIIEGSERMEIEQNITNHANAMTNEEKEELKEEYHAFKKEMKPRLSAMSIVAFIPAIVGYIMWIIPLGLNQWLADKYVTSQVFYSSVRISGGILISLFYHSLISIILLFFNYKYSIIYLLLLPLGYAYIYMHHKNQHAHLDDYASKFQDKRIIDVA